MLSFGNFPLYDVELKEGMWKAGVDEEHTPE
jgi:hypothetical protein